MSKIFVGDVVPFVFTCMYDDGVTPIDLTNENNLLLVFNCDNTVVTAAPTKVPSPNNNVLTYTTLPTDLSVAGQWYVQLETEKTNLPGHSTIFKFKVNENLKKV